MDGAPGRTGPWGLSLLPWAVFGAAPHSYLKYRSIVAREEEGVHLHFEDSSITKIAAQFLSYKFTYRSPSRKSQLDRQIATNSGSYMVPEFFSIS